MADERSEEAVEPVGRAMADVRRSRSARWLVGVLAGLLGFAIVVQVRSTQQGADLSTARTSDLVRILDDLGERADRLDQEAARLQATRDDLATGVDQQQVARRALQQQLRTLEVLAGTVPVHGPGVRLLVADPRGAVDAAELLDAVQELRDAGAEAIEVDGIRWGATTSVTDGGDGLRVDGHPVRAPFEVLAIGDPETLASSLAIPGGVVESIREVGADVVVERKDDIRIESLIGLSGPQYAHPASSGP